MKHIFMTAFLAALAFNAFAEDRNLECQAILNVASAETGTTMIKKKVFFPIKDGDYETKIDMNGSDLLVRIHQEAHGKMVIGILHATVLLPNGQGISLMQGYEVKKFVSFTEDTWNPQYALASHAHPHQSGNLTMKELIAEGKVHDGDFAGFGLDCYSYDTSENK